MIGVLFIISSVFMFGYSAKIDEFCSNPVVDAAVFISNEKCFSCVHIFYGEYFFNLEHKDNDTKNKFRSNNGTKIHSVWADIPTPLDSVISLTNNGKNLIWFKDQNWWQTNDANKIVSKGSTIDWPNWPSNLIDILPENVTNYYVLYGENGETAMRSCVIIFTQNNQLQKLDCDKNSYLIRVSNQNQNKIQLISSEKVDDTTSPLAKLIDLAAANNYEDKSININWMLFGKNDKMCLINQNEMNCKTRKITTWIQCKRKPRKQGSTSNSEITMALVIVIVAFILFSMIGIGIVVLIATTGKKKRKHRRKSKSCLQVGPQSGIRETRYVELNLPTAQSGSQPQRDAKGSGSFIFSGQTIDKPIPNEVDTYATAFQDNKASESEIFKKRPVHLAVKSRTGRKSTEVSIKAQTNKTSSPQSPRGKRYSPQENKAKGSPNNRPQSPNKK